MEEKKRKLLNRTDKPDNVVERENEILEKCGRIEEELPSWLRGYFMYLRSNVLPMTRQAYLQDIRFFCEYLLKETELAPGITKIKDLYDAVFHLLHPLLRGKGYR